MKSPKLLLGLAASFALLSMLALAPPVAADSVGGIYTLEGSESAISGIDGARVSASGVTVDPSAFPATRLSTTDISGVRVGWELTADAYKVGAPGIDNGTVHALATAADGTVYAGGSFTSAGGSTAIQYVAKWRRGTGWEGLGTFSAGTVRALAIGPDGSVYAGGDFGEVLKWNGSTWSSLGAVFSGGSVRALAVGQDGSIYVGGDFTAPAAGLARYSGGSWSAVGSGIYNNNSDVYALLFLGNDLYVGGSFLNVGAANGLPAANLARWDGSNWYTVGSSPPLGAQQSVDALATSEGNLYVANRDVAAGGFHFYQVTGPAGSSAVWNQLAYSSNCPDTLSNCDRIYAVAASQNNIFIGGTFTNSNATFTPALAATTGSVAWWNRKANTWSAMDGGVTASANGAIPGWMQGVHALALDRSSLYAGGEFATAKGTMVAAARVSRWSQPTSDLALYGTASPSGTVYVGDQITYNLTVENLGYAQATSPTIYAALPTGLTFVSASGCTHSSGIVTCNLSSINSGASTTRSIVVRVPATSAGATTYDFSANVKANQYDPTLVSPFFGSSQVAFSHTSQEKAVLTLDMTGPAAAHGDDVLTYNMTVVNTGPSTGRNVILTDALPAGAVYKAGSSGCTASGGTVTCSLGDLAVGGSKTVFVSFMTGSCFAGSLTNSASATSPQTQTPATDSVDTTVSAFTGLAINKTDGVTLVGLNEALAYKIHAWACGTGIADVLVTDALPAQLTFVSATTTAGACAQSDGTVTCNVGTLADGGSVDVTINTTTNAETTLNNTAEASGTGATTVSSTDNDTQVGDYADLALALTAPQNVTAGVAYDYTIAVTNLGPSAVADAAVAVDLPDGIYYNSATGATCTVAAENISANLTCTLGAVAVGATVQMTVNATAVQPVQGPDETYTATATVSSLKDTSTLANNRDSAETTATAGTTAAQTLTGLTVKAYVFETVGTEKRAYGVGSLGDHFYLGGLNDHVDFGASGATSLDGGGALTYKKGDVPVYEGAFGSTQAAAWKLTLDSAGEAKVPDVAGFKIKVPENSTLTEVSLPNGKVKGTTEELKVDPPNTVKEVSADFELDSSTSKPEKPSYGGKVKEPFRLDAGIFKLDVPVDAPISDEGIKSTNNVDLVMPAYFGSGEVNGSSTNLRHWPGLTDASMTVGGAVGSGFAMPDLKFDRAENFKLKGGTGQLVSAGGKYETVITSAKLQLDLPANAGKEVKKAPEQGGTLDTVYLGPKEDDAGQPVLTEDGSIDSEIGSTALPEFHLEVAKGDLKVVSAMLKKDGLSVSLADLKMPRELGERRKLTPDVKVTPKKDVTQADMKVKDDQSFEVADMNVKDGEKLKVKDAQAKVVQQRDGFKLDVVSGKVQVTVLEQNDKETDLGSATVDKDGRLDGKLANDELTVKVASTDLTLKGLAKEHSLTSEKGLESDAGKWKLPPELGSQELDFTPPDKIKIDDRGLKINEDKDVDFPAGNLDNSGHPFDAGKAKLKEAADRTYKLEIHNKVQVDIPGSQGKNPGTGDKPDAELELDSQKRIKGTVKDMELKVGGLTLKDTDWQVENGQVFSDKAEMEQIEDFGGSESQLGQMAVLDKTAGLVLGEEAGAAAAAGMSPDAIAEVADINVTLPSLEYLGFSMFNVEGSVQATDRYAANGNYCVDDDTTDYPDECDGVKDSYAIHALASLGLEDMMGGGGGDDGGGSGGGSGGDGGGGGSLPCSSISVTIDLVLGEHQATMVSVKPQTGRILAKTIAQEVKPASANGAGDLELRAIAAQLMLSCSIPLGQSGLQISEFNGGFEMDKDKNLLRINVGASIETVMAVPPPIDAAVAEGAVTATVEVRPERYFRVEGEVTVIGFIKMAEGYAQVDFTEYGMPNGVQAEVTLRFPVFMEGYVGFHVWTDWDPVNGNRTPELDDFHFNGWAGVRVGISKGLIWEGCGPGGEVCISIPPWDLWLAEVRAEIGEFCAEDGGTVWGFKCEISVLNGLWSGGMYVDAAGTIDFGDVEEYVLYNGSQVAAAEAAWRQVQEGKLTAGAAFEASQKYEGFAFAPDDVSHTYLVDTPSDLAFLLSRTGDVPTMTLTDPNGTVIDQFSDGDVALSGRADVQYIESTTTIQDEDGNDVVTTQVTYAIDHAIAGPWTIHLHGVDEADADSDYIFTVLGAGLAPSLSSVAVTQPTDATKADVSWTLTDDASPTVNIYATLGPIETSITSPADSTKQITLPVFGGERLLQVTNSKFDGTVNTRTVDLSGLENGEYYIHVEADDAKDPPQHQYWLGDDGTPAKLVINRPLPADWNPAITVTPEYMGLHVEFEPLLHPDIDQFVVRFADQPEEGAALAYMKVVSTTTTFANSEDWLVPGQTYYISVGAFDGEAEDLDADGVPGTIIWSDTVTGVPLGASFELTATDPTATVVGGGDSATVYFKVIDTGDFAANVGLQVKDAPEGIDVTLADRFVVASPNGATTALSIHATDTLRGGVYPVTIAGSAGGTVRTLDLLVTVEEPRFELAATPATLTLETGETASVAIEVTRLFDEADPVNLEVTAPSGLGWSLDDDRLEGSESATLTLIDTFLLPGDEYVLHVTGRDGENVYDLPIRLSVIKPSFTLAAAPLNRWVAPGQSVAIELELGVEDGWSTPVTLSINPNHLPYGITGGLAATPDGTPVSTLTVTPPTSAYLKLSAAADAAEDLYVLHVDATSGEKTEVVEPRLWVLTTCNVADLSVTVSDSPDPVLTGGNVTYSLAVANNGPCASYTRSLTAVLPTGMTFVSGTGCTASGCSVPAMAVGATTQVSMVASAPSTGTGSLLAPFSLDASSTDWEKSNDSATAETRLNNAPAVGDISLQPSAIEGQDVYAAAQFTDADGNGPFTCTVNYGSGEESGRVVEGECLGAPYTYTGSGDYAITFTVTDADGATATRTMTLGVANAAPVVGAVDISLKPSTENQSVVISANFTDAGTADGPFTCTVDFGDEVIVDGVAENSTCRAAAHLYEDNGEFEVTVSVTDKDGGTGTRTSTTVVNNVDPVLASVTSDGPVVEGGTATITAIATDVAAARDPLTYWFDCRDDGFWEFGPQTENTAECAFQDDGEYETQVRVGDGDGGWAFGSVAVVVTNAVPVVDPILLSPPSPLSGGGRVGASASFTDAGVLDFPRTSTLDADGADEDKPTEPATCTVDYGDGTIQERPVRAGTCYGLAHRYAASLDYTITITVTDKDGGMGTRSVPYTVLNMPPSVDTPVVTPVSSEEGSPVTVSANFTDPDEADTFTCEIDYGDGSPAAAFAANGRTCTGPEHTYAEDGSYTVTVTVTDGFGISDGDSTNHVVSNVAPTVEAPVVLLEPSDEGSSVTASAAFTDPGTVDTFTCRVSYGDGSEELDGTVTGNTCTGPAHVYVDNTTPPEDGYTVRITVTDDDLGVGSNATTHVVNNVAPAVQAVEVVDEPSNEGSPVTISSGFTDPGVADTFTCTVDYGDGSPVDSGTVVDHTCSATHMYSDDGLYNVTIGVTDKDGGVGSSSATHAVNNVAPSVAVPVFDPETSFEGSAVTASATFTDPGSLDTFACTVDYGDGSAAVDGAVTDHTCYAPNHAYVDNGTYPVTITVTDHDGGTGSNSTPHVVNNVAPTVLPPGMVPEPSVEGGAVTASATFSDPGTGDTFTCKVSYGDGSAEIDGELSGTVATGYTCTGPAHVYVDNSTPPVTGYSVTITVIDDDGGSNSNSSTHVVNNVAPQVGPPAVVDEPSDEGSSVTISAGFTDPGVNDTFTCQVSFGDGSSGGGEDDDHTCTATHTYADNGSYTVTVTVTDDDGGTGSNSSTHVVNNVAPVVDAGPDAAIDEGSAFVSSGFFTDPGADIWIASVDYGDGAGEQPLILDPDKSFDLSHIYADNRVYTVTVCVADDDDPRVCDSAQVTVQNVAPTVAVPVIDPEPSSEGSAVTASATFTDPGVNDGFTCEIGFGDGSTVAGVAGNHTCTASHTYADNATPEAGGYLVTIRVTDDDGGAGSNSKVHVVNNVAPEVDAGSDAVVDEGSLFASSGFFTDPGADAWIASVDYGEGSGVQPLTLGANKSFDLSHIYSDNGVYTVTVCVTDDEGASGCDSAEVTVANVAPTVEEPVIAFEPSNEGSAVSVTANFSDPGTKDILTCKLNYGDGTGDANGTVSGTVESGYKCTASHTFADNATPEAGGYLVTITVTDDDRGSGTNSLTHIVNNVAPMVADPVIDPAVSNEGSLIAISASFTDPGTVDSFTCTVDYDDGSLVDSGPAVDHTCDSTHTYADNGSYTVTVTVTDDDGDSGNNSSTHVVNNVAPVADAGPDATIDEGSSFVSSGSFTDPGADVWFATVDYGDGPGGQPLTLGANRSFALSHIYADNGDYTVTVCVADDEDASDCDSAEVTVENAAPIVAAPLIDPAASNEGDAVTASATFSDPGVIDTFTCKVGYGDGPNQEDGKVSGTVESGYTCTGPSHTYTDNGSYTVTVIVTDDELDSGSNTTTHLVSNVAPEVKIDPEPQTAQYSDHISPVTITATDMTADPLVLSTRWTSGNGAYTDGLPGSLTLVAGSSCTDLPPYSHTCTWTLSGVLNVPAGIYTIEATVDDGDGGKTTVSTVVIVTAEDVDFTFPDTNPGLVKTATAGGNSGDFTLSVIVEEKQPDLGLGPEAGDISLAKVGMALQPVGPGSAPTPVRECSQTPTGSGYDGYVTLTCSFTGVAVNTYVIAVTVDGGYYAGYSEDVVTVYDPSLGFTSGGGSFFWPGTADEATGYPGDKTNFGFTMKYKKGGANVSGNLLVIRHLPDDQIYRLKSNALAGLSLSAATSPFGWANFSGKATYSEPGWPEPLGNYTFIVYVEDGNEPGTRSDRFWIEIKEKGVTIVPALSLDRLATANAVPLAGGNIVVPHGGGKAASQSSFTAIRTGGAVRLEWEALGDPSLVGFNLYRSSTGEGEWMLCNAEPVRTSSGEAMQLSMYEWLDGAGDPAVDGWYLLEAVYLDGATEPLSQARVESVADRSPLWLPLVGR